MTIRKAGSPRWIAGGLLGVWLATGGSLRAQFQEDNYRQLLNVPAWSSGDLFGWRVAALGDVNADGMADFAVGAPFFNTNRGRIGVFSGADGSELWRVTGSRASDILGFELKFASDLDGDGVRDLLGAAPFSQQGGRVHVWSGATGVLLHRFSRAGSSLGSSIATEGDYDGDGVFDLAIGDLSFNNGAGRVFVYSGADFSLIDRLNPPVATDTRFGVAAGFLGDVNGDQRDDLAIGVRLSGDLGPGRIEVFSFDGTDDVHLYTIDGVDHGCGLCGNHLDGGKDVNGDGVPDLFMGEESLSQVQVFSGVDGSQLLLIPGNPGGFLGSGGELIDDVNGDGRADIVAGAPFDGAGGSITVFSGLDGSPLSTLSRSNGGRFFGQDVHSLGDENGDGFPEVLVGGQGRAWTISRCNASWHEFGTGVAGTLGTPSLTLVQPPVLGSNLALNLDNSLGTPTAGLLLIGFEEAALPGSFGGNLWLLPIALVPLSLPAGGATLSGSIPDDPALCGVRFLLQALELDGGAPAGLSSTPGVRVYLGR